MDLDLLTVISTKTVGQFALYAGGVAFVMVCFLTVQVAWLRFRLIRRLAYKKRVQETWRQYIARVFVGDDCDMPSINGGDVYYVLEEFDYTFGIIKGPELDRIRQSLCSIDLPLSLHELLHSKDIRKKLYALVTLGNLHDKTAWGSILNCLNAKQTVISLAAARALVLIDPERAVKEIIPEILQREDWPWANLASILKLAGPKLVCKNLSAVIESSDQDKQASLLRMYRLLRCEEEYPITFNLLKNATEDKVMSVCLNISQDPDIVQLAREHVTHPRWHIRMNAAVALGRFGNESDIPRLLILLKDSEWWVRYRAARALVKMPGIDKAAIQSIRANLTDRYADDILVHVLNEADYT